MSCMHSGGCLGLEMPDGFRKNVYFGFGDFMNRINALCGNRVYFCIPGRKRSPRKIKGCAPGDRQGVGGASPLR